MKYTHHMAACYDVTSLMHCIIIPTTARCMSQTTCIIGYSSAILNHFHGYIENTWRSTDIDMGPFLSTQPNPSNSCYQNIHFIRFHAVKFET